jgi:hypothetical protein
MYELRQDMNKMLKHQGLPFIAMLPPPPIFLEFPEYTTSEGEDEGEKDRGSPLAEEDLPAAQTKEDEDTKPLSAKMAKLRKEVVGKKAMGPPFLSEQGGRSLLGGPSGGLLISLLALTPILEMSLIALFLRLRRRNLASVMMSDSLQVQI